MGQGRPITLTSSLETDYTLTNAWANVPDLTLPPIESDGWYDIKSYFTFRNAAASDDGDTRIAIDGNPIYNTTMRAINTHASIHYWLIVVQKDAVWLKKGEVVSIQAMYTAAGGKIEYDPGKGYIQATKRGS